MYSKSINFFQNQMFTVSAEIAEKNQSSSTLLPVTNFASENSNSHFKRKSDLESLETFGKKYRLDDSGESCLEKSKAQQDKINNNFVSVSKLLRSTNNTIVNNLYFFRIILLKRLIKFVRNLKKSRLTM